jgi:hypothetical protein
MKKTYYITLGTVNRAEHHTILKPFTTFKKAFKYADLLIKEINNEQVRFLITNNKNI